MGTKGSRSSWLPTLGSLLSDAFEREKAVDDVYEGDVFKDRIGHSTADGEGDREERLVARLYKKCVETHSSVVLIGREKVLLLGYQWPTQGGNREKKRCADLVGMTSRESNRERTCIAPCDEL